MPSVKTIFEFVVDPELVKRLDDFRFKHRFDSRAAAIKWLLSGHRSEAKTTSWMR